jgi:hypothetical protein
MKRWSPLLLVLPTVALAQLNMELEAESGYTSNAFNNYTQAADYYTSLSVQANYDHISEDSGWRGFYSGSIDAFKQYQDRTYQMHGLGITHFRQWGEKGHRWQSGLTVQKRLHSEEYRWYELQQLTAYTNFKWLVSESLYLYAGLNLLFRDYSLLKAFSYEQQNLFTRLSWFSASGTSVSVEANVLVKNYLHSASTSGPAELPDLITVGNGGSRQMVAGIRVAQSLSPSLGVSMAVTQRHNFNNSLRYLGSAEGYYYSDEELFDDIYGYHGIDVSPSVKKLFNHGISLSLGATWQHKQYDNRMAAQYDGSLYEDGRLRDDQRSLMWLGVEKKWTLHPALTPLVLSLRYTQIQNRSNDPYYTYNTGWIGMSMSQAF